jgi:hypothetical protein
MDTHIFVISIIEGQRIYLVQNTCDESYNCIQRTVRSKGGGGYGLSSLPGLVQFQEGVPLIASQLAPQVLLLS